MLCLQSNASGSFLQKCINFVEQQFTFSHFEGSIIPYIKLEFKATVVLSYIFEKIFQVFKKRIKNSHINIFIEIDLITAKWPFCDCYDPTSHQSNQYFFKNIGKSLAFENI